MPDYRTHDYDIVLELSEGILGLLAGFLSDLLPNGCSDGFENIPMPAGLVSGACTFHRNAGGSIDLNTTVTDGVRLELSFDMSASFDGRPPGWPPHSPDPGGFGGSVSIIAQVTVLQRGMSRCFGLDFAGLRMNPDRVQVTDLPDLPPEWAAHETDLRACIAEIIREGLIRQGTEDFGQLLCITIDPGNTGADPLTPVDVHARVIRGDTTNCVAILMPTIPGGPDPSAFEECFIGPSEDLVMAVGNEVLLRRIIGLNILEELGVLDRTDPDVIDVLHATLDFTGGMQCHLREPVDLGHLLSLGWGTRADLRELSIAVTHDERIDVRAQIAAGGPFIEAFASMHLSATVEPDVASGAVIHWHVYEPVAIVMPGPLSWLLFGGFTLIESTISPIARRFIWGVMEGFFPARECRIVDGAEWPESPEPLDVDCTFDLGLPLPIAIDDIILDDWAFVGRATLPDPAYESRPPSLEIMGEWEVTDSGIASIRPENVPGVVRAERIIRDQAHRGDFRAVASMMRHPIDFQWCLGGYTITGEGSVTINGTEVSYTVDDDVCHLSLEMGDSLDTEICVSALDADLLELFALSEVSVRGQEEHWSFFLPDPSDIAFLAEWQLVSREPSPAEAMTPQEHRSMVSSAFRRGMGMDPHDPVFRRGG